jgi:hypothetical protein
MKSQKGSALVVAILLSTVMLVVLASLLSRSLSEYRGAMKSYFDTAAFSLAESGIDRAAAFITAAGFDTAVTTEPTGAIGEAGVWYKKMNGATVKYYRGYFPAVDFGNNRRGTCSVLVEPAAVSGTTTTYTVYALGSASGGSGIGSQRALRVQLASTTTGGSGGGAAVAAQTSMEFGMGANENSYDVPGRNAHLLVASYDSTLNNGRPDMIIDRKTGKVTGTNFGDSAMVGLKAKNGTATLYSSLIYGTVAVGGAKTTLNVVANTKYGTAECISNNPYAACVIDLKAAAKWESENTAGGKPYMGFNMDPDSTGGPKIGDNVAYNYTFDDNLFALSGFKADDTFDASGYTKVKAIDGNNNKELPDANVSTTKTVLGPTGYTANAGTKTVTYLNSVNGLGEIVVKGDAVLVLSGPANLGNGDGVKLSFVDSVSKLTVVLAEATTTTIKFANADNNISDRENLDPAKNPGKGTVGYSPDRLTITSIKNADFILRVGAQQAVAAIVKIPKGKVSVDCTDNNKANQFRGQLIADKISLSGTTYLDIFYDINLGGAIKNKPALSLASWKQIVPSGFAQAL